MAETNDRLILASASPRRRQLMSEAGYAFDVQPSDVPEDLPAESDDPAQVACRLAEAKARAIAAGEPSSGRWIIGADTIVVLGRRIIGKPRDAADAVAILARLSGSEHSVITGLALVRGDGAAGAAGVAGRSLVRAAETRIRMREIPEEEIRRYVDQGGSDGKAGAYAIQEGGDRYIERLDGSLTNVIGLPMELLAEMLDEVGYGRPAE